MRIFELCGRGRLTPVFALAYVVAALVGTANATAYPQTPSGSANDPAALVRRASKNELRSTVPPAPVRYKLRKQDDKGITTKEIVETKDGDVARLIAKNDKPLTPQEDQAELDRLNDLLAHPEIQEHRHKREQEDSGRADEMTRLLPDAFIYTDLGLVPGPNGPAHRLAFKPNPNFRPPDREAEVYQLMYGELLIDEAQERIVKLDAHLVDDVNFGWGILEQALQRRQPHHRAARRRPPPLGDHPSQAQPNRHRADAQTAQLSDDRDVEGLPSCTR